MAVYSNSKQFTNTSNGNYTHYVSMTYTQNVIDNYTNVSNLVAKLQNRTPNLSFPYGTVTGTISIYKYENEKWVLQYSNGISSNVNLNTSNIITLKDVSPNVKIYHNNDGTCKLKIVYTTAMSGVVAGPDGTSTFEFDLPKIPRNSSLNSVTDLISNSTSSFDVENNNFKLNITKNVATYYDKLVVSVKKSDDSLVDLVELNDVINENEISLNDYKSVIYENSIDTALPIIRFSIYTYTDETMETQIGSVSYKELTGIINSVPIINGFSYKDSNNTTLSKTGNNQIFIKYYSTLTLSDFNFEAKNSATITNVNVNGNIFAYTDNMVVNISNYDLDYVSVYAIDSRGLTSAEYKIALNVKNYFNMIKNESSYTRIGYTDECIFKFRGQFFNDTFGAENNSLVINYRYKNVLASEDEWQTGTSTIIPTLNGNEFVFDGVIKGDNNAGFSVNNSFDVEIVVSDAFSSVPYKYQVISGIPAIDVYKSKLGLCKNYDETSTHDIEGTNANFESLYVNDKEVGLKKDIEIIYSYNETKTNKIWLDGKPIYRKTFYSTSKEQNFNIPHGVSIDTVVAIDGYYRMWNTTWFRLGCVYYLGNLEYLTALRVSGENIEVNLGGWINRNSNMITHVTLEYTKTTD